MLVRRDNMERTKSHADQRFFLGYAIERHFARGDSAKN
jgi:hypothetical protein